MEAIDRTHGDGNLDKIPVRQSSGTKTLGGYLHSFTGKPLEISVSRQGDHPRMTTAHEVGHFLDHQGIGISGQFASARDELLSGWRKTVFDSKAYKKLQEMQINPPSVEVEVSGGKYTYRADRRYLGYLLSPEELFARSYAQYVATRSEDTALRKELREIQQEKGPIKYPTQWDDKDFGPIAKVFDGLFSLLGWRQ